MEDRTSLNRQLAQMLKGGVIMDVTTPEQARIAEEAGACAVMALERIPADIRAAGGVSRMSDPKMIKGIQEAVSIPVMAKCRIGHFAEAQILQAIEIDYIDESEVLSPADDVYHIDKRQFQVPFVCGAKDLGEALRRINEGATMIRTKGEPGTGDVVQAVRHMRMMQSEIRRLTSMNADELYEAAKQLRVPFDLVQYVHDNGKLPVVNFAAGDVRIVLRTIEYYHIAPAHLAESLQAHALQPGGHRTDVEIAIEARPHDGLAHQQAVAGLQGRQHGIGGDDEDIKQEDACQEPQQVEEQQREHCSHQPHKGTL